MKDTPTIIIDSSKIDGTAGAAGTFTANFATLTNGKYKLRTGYSDTTKGSAEINDFLEIT